LPSVGGTVGTLAALAALSTLGGPGGVAASLPAGIAALAPYLGGLTGNAMTAISGGIGTLGGTAARMLSNITGFGDYKIRINSLMDASAADAVPLFSTIDDGSLRVRHREFLADIASSATPSLFQVASYAIDASNPTTFPWLSQLSENFEEYTFRGLIFEAKTSCGSISTTGQLGTTIMATQYNSLALPFVNKQQMEAYSFACSTVISKDLIHPIECDPAITPSQGIFYTNQPGIIASDNDKRWSQLGNFSIATQGCPTASLNVCELWVSYDVILRRPRLLSGSNLLYDHWQFSTGIAPNGGAGPYFGTNPALTSGSFGFTTLAPSTLYWSTNISGNFLVIYYVHGSSGTWVAPDASIIVGNATYLNLLTNNTDSDITLPSFTNTYTQTLIFVKILPYQTIGLGPEYGSSIELGLNTSGTYDTPTSGDLFIIQLPDSAN
jgi:hypothetical protein